MGSDCGMSLFISYCNFILLEKNPNNIVNKTIVTILCDGAERYKSKIFNEKFLRGKNLNYKELNKQLI